MSHTNATFSRLKETVLLLRGKNGCPWDKRQSTESLVKHLKSEFQELLDAIDISDNENICEELGDLLYLIVMISQIHYEKDDFSIDDVIVGVTEKLIRRHPHVFAGKKITDEQQLREQWERIKAEEKSKK